MFEAAVAEFPFVETLPRSEKSKVARVWDLLHVMAAVTKVEGQLVPVMLAAKLLDYTRSSIDNQVEAGRLKRVDIDGHVFITENSIVAFAKEERKMGRPRKVPSNKEVWAASVDFARGCNAKKK